MWNDDLSPNMDAVITYVDGNDPVWRADYQKYTDVSLLEKRFRDWGTLKYLLRGIERCMPFIRNVYLVVSHETQVPEWADRENLKIVLHKDIIPEEFLPVFNSTAIEMFLHRIQGLDERYVYFNDDMFPVRDCKEAELFRDGKAVIGMTSHILASGMYKKQCRNSDRLARRVAGRSSSLLFVRPQHICSPMLRSECERLYKAAEGEIRDSVSRVREERNYNQYLFLDYMFHRGRLIPEKISNKHFSTAVASADSLKSFILHPSRTFCCINDVRLKESKFQQLQKSVLDSFEQRFPEKSRFEK